MTLCRATFFLFALFAPLAFASGQAFEIPQYQLALEAPSGWVHDKDDQFGFVLYDPNSPGKKRKIRVHNPVGKATSPKEQVRLSVDSINLRRKENGQTLERIQYEKPVTTNQGVEGYLASHGFEGEQDRGYINHYYFKSPSGRIVCICVYLSGATKEEEARLENIILNSLTFTPAKNSVD